MEPNLLVIGLNHRTASRAMRERFWIGEESRYEALWELGQAEGIEEAVVLADGNRTEFLLWAGEPTAAANSILHFLSSRHGLRLSEWEHFYRLVDEAALIHIFRVVSGVDCMALGEPQIIAQVRAAWEQARAVGTSGRFMDSILEKALSVAEQTHLETADLTAAIAEAEKIVLANAQGFLSKLHAQSVLPTIVALRQRLDEICRQELESFTAERGPFTREQDQALHAITAQLIQKIAGSLARELKGLPEETEQKQMTAAVHRLFRLESPQTALAGAILERNEHEQPKSSIAAITH